MSLRFMVALPVLAVIAANATVAGELRLTCSPISLMVGGKFLSRRL